jgi:predicted permease
MPAEVLFALRRVLHRPGFLVLSSSTLALGIAANLALFSLLDAVYFRPLPLREPSRLVTVASTSPKAFGGLISYIESQEIAASVPAFEEVAAVGKRGVTFRQNEETRLAIIHYVSPRFFEVFGIPLQIGRGFRGTDDASPSVIVNHRFWQEQLSGRPDVIGSTIQLDDKPFTVVGVAARGFVGLDRTVQTDVWVPVQQAPLVVPGLRDELADRNHRWFEVYARLGPRAGREEAQAQLDALAKRWGRDDPQQYPEAGLRLQGFSDSHGAEARQGAIFLAFPALVLLIACANVANLLLARNEARRRELAVSVALGAGRGRIFRQLLAESLILTFCGTALGVLGAAFLIALFPSLVPPGAITYTIDARIDARLLSFCLALFLGSTVLIALATASRFVRPGVAGDLKTGRSSPRRARAQHLLVAGQITIGVVVLVAAALIVRSLRYSAGLRPGFDSGKQVATFYLVPALKGYDDEQTFRLFEESRLRLLSLPSVRRVSYAIRLPAQGNEAGWAEDFVIPGKEPPSGEQAFHIRYTMVGPDYFELVGTRILRGRGVQEVDRPEGRPVAVISETMAKRIFPSEDPIGKTLVMKDVAREIVGVCEDVRIGSLYEAPEMYVYLPYAQARQGFALLLVELDGDPAVLVRAAKTEIARVAPDVPVLETEASRATWR